METILNISQIVISILLIACILLQQRGEGLGSAFGGSDSVAVTRRGAEKTLFTISVVLAVLFLGIAVAQMFVA
jgi:preprotein translocase subunit SecG